MTYSVRTFPNREEILSTWVLIEPCFRKKQAVIVHLHMRLIGLDGELIAQSGQALGEGRHA